MENHTNRESGTSRPNRLPESGRNELRFDFDPELQELRWLDRVRREYETAPEHFGLYGQVLA